MTRLRTLAMLCFCISSTVSVQAQSAAGQGAGDAQKAVQETTGKGQSDSRGLGTKNTMSKPATQSETGASKPATAGENAASTSKLRLGPLAPSTPPTNVPHNRPVIGVAMGGGGALGLSEIGTLQWLAEHHIPIDVIAGTSMGSILAALYSTGHTPAEMKKLLNGNSVNQVFRLSPEYTSLNYRRREEQREIPSGIGVGLRHGVSLRNALLTDTGLNELLDREFLAYNDQTDFNNLPIPFRCQATDLNSAKTVTFARGSLQDAVRASASIPGVFRPFALDGHEFVDGSILENLPTPDVKAMGADIVIAISLPLAPVGKGDLDSIIGVLQRAFAVGIEANEAKDRKLADVVIMPDITGFTATDYLLTDKLAARGYAAAEAHKTQLMKYAVSDAEWDAYLAHIKSLQRPDAGNVIEVKVKAPNQQLDTVVHTIFRPLVGKPVDTDAIDKKLAEVRADGRYEADYTVGYDSKRSNDPIILVSVSNKKTGPPFLDLGLDLEAQTGGDTRATFAGILKYQDLGGYGSAANIKFDLGFLTRVEGEYYWKPRPLGKFFLAPRADLTRRPYYIYDSTGYRLAERESQYAGVAADAGWTDGKYQELRAGLDFENVQWTETVGADGQPNYGSNSQLARVHYVFDNQDRALVPRKGIRAVLSGGFLYGLNQQTTSVTATNGFTTTETTSSRAPRIEGQVELAHSFSPKDVVLANVQGGTMFNRPVAQPFRFTLGGPLHLAASSIDQYRGTDYWLATPGYLHRVFALPAPLGQNVYIGGTYEIGQMRSPDGIPVLTRQDFYVGIVAETPFGVITLAPAFGDHGERKFTFTLGKFF